MKKFLSILATLVVTSSSASVVVALDNVKEVKLDTNFTDKNNKTENNESWKEPEVSENTKDKEESVTTGDNNVNGENDQQVVDQNDNEQHGWPKPVIEIGNVDQIMIRNIDGQENQWNYGLIRIHNIFSGSTIIESLKVIDTTNDHSLLGASEYDLTNSYKTTSNNDGLFYITKEEPEYKRFIDLKVNVNTNNLDKVITNKFENHLTENKDLKNLKVVIKVKYEANDMFQQPEQNMVSTKDIALGIDYNHYRKDLFDVIVRQENEFLPDLGSINKTVRTDDRLLAKLNNYETKNTVQMKLLKLILIT